MEAHKAFRLGKKPHGNIAEVINNDKQTRGGYMSVTSEIAVWANEQADWVSDAVQRVFSQGTLSAEDVADMAALVKTSLGIRDPGKRVAKRLDMAMLPAEEQTTIDVSLTAIRNPKNINALGSADGVTFEPDGLTIMYGHNGAGKSGYARVLKKACRARNSEGIIPNVFAPPAPQSPAQARFEWRADKTDGGADWEDGTPSPATLSRIAVFDTHCARVFVDDQAEVSYIPYGMDVLRELAAGQQAAQKLLEIELQCVKYDKKKLASLEGDNIVGKLVASLKPTTDPEHVEALATLSDDETEELALLIKQLREEDPAKQATALRRFAARLQITENELAQLEAPFLDEDLSKLRTALEQLVATETASKIAATGLEEGGKALPGTGTNPWEVLVRSAVAYAAEAAYTEHPFPGPKDARCVLCQQPLTLEAQLRLKLFVQFLEADAQKQYAGKRKLAGELYVAIANTDFAKFPSDKVLLDELAEVSPKLYASIHSYIEGLEARQSAVKSMAPSRKLDDLPAVPESPAPALKSLREKMLSEAEVLDKTLTPEQRKVKTARLADLEARAKLKVLLPTVLEAIAIFQLEQTLAEAVRCCNTAAVTRKLNELYEKTVTAELREALQRELTGLGLGAVKVVLEMSGQKGARMQQLKLAAAGPFGKVKLSGVLSEGEQRATALASFLAEIGLEQSRSGIVFDDPVSSLDHLRREQIASRLALEAKSRQVIVFTHDLAFAWSLREFSDIHGAKHAERHIYAAGDSKGHCCDALPFEAKRLDGRVNDLRALATRAKAELEQNKDHNEYNDLVRGGYRRARDTWELLVEDLLFAGTVKRFRRSVNTKMLRYVVVEDHDVKAIYEGMTRCSNFVHEGGAEAPIALPSADEFLADIEKLGAAVLTIKARKADVERRRKENGVHP